MSQPLPNGGFRWVEDCDGLAGTIKDQPADGPRAISSRWTWGTPRSFTMSTTPTRSLQSAWLFKKSGCRSISMAFWAQGWRPPRSKSWSPTSATRTTTCSTTTTSSSTRDEAEKGTSRSAL